MNVQVEKLELIKMLLHTEKETILNKVRTALETEQPKRISIEQYNKEIDEANARIDKGEFYTQEEVEKMAEKW